MKNFLFAISLILLVGCGETQTTVHQSIDSHPHPRYKVQHLTRSGGGAAGFSYDYIIIIDKKTGEEMEVMRGKGIRKVNLSWRTQQILGIDYNVNARIDMFRNWIDILDEYRIQIAAIDLFDKQSTRHHSDSMMYEALPSTILTKYQVKNGYAIP